MKTVEITNKKVVEQKYGGISVNYDYVVTTDLGVKSAGSGSFAISARDGMPQALRANVEYKLGSKSFTLLDAGDDYASKAGAGIEPVKRGPGRPPLNRG